MAVNSVSTPIDLTASHGAKPKQEQNNEVHQQAATEARRDDGHHDRTAEEAKPSVNTHGQSVGKIINTKA